jgi:hypothetical protein
MRIFNLIRITEINDGTFGVFLDDKVPFALTIERRWENNQMGISCIPVGSYTCLLVNSPKFGKTFEVTAVPGRSEILFHQGNINDDSHGCIIVGEQFEFLGSKVAVLSSAKGFAEFLERTTWLTSFTLNIFDRRI